MSKKKEIVREVIYINCEAISSSTSHLSPEKSGILYRLLCDFYFTGRPIEADVEKIELIGSGLIHKKSIKKFREILIEFFILKNDGWHPKRKDLVSDKNV